MFPSTLQSNVQRERMLDRPLWLGVLGLMLFGAAFIFSATGAGEAARNAACCAGSAWAARQRSTDQPGGR